MARVLRPEYNHEPVVETCDWGFFSGSRCGDRSLWYFGENFSVCELNYAQLVDIHSRIPLFSRRFHRES
jgi:hypothetical protein